MSALPAMPENDDASAARKATIGVHLTPHAPGCSRLGIENPKRWRAFYAKTPPQVLASVLTRLAREPDEIRLAELRPNPAQDPDVEILVDGVPHAVIYDGLTLSETTAALASLRAAGWRPAPPTSPSN